MLRSLVIFLAPVIFAQAPALQIVESKLVSVNSTRDDVNVKLRNESGKGVRAYTLILRFTQNDGKPGLRLFQNHVLGLGNAVLRERQPGEVWSDEWRLPRFKGTQPVPPFTIDVDYVLFTDGSSAGPDREKQSLKIDGMITGFALGERSATNPRP